MDRSALIHWARFNELLHAMDALAFEVVGDRNMYEYIRASSNFLSVFREMNGYIG